MSEKPVLKAQECDPSTLGLARKPRPAMKRKPETEVVVQLGPFTDGQITSPEMVRPLEGPTEWLIKPKTGEIVPFDSGSTPEKDVIRKYITVGAQDNDVPQDLPNISDGYVVDRVSQAALPNMDAPVRENGRDIMRVFEREGPASVEYKTTTTVNTNEGPTPDPHVCPPSPPHVCPPIPVHECPPPEPHLCPPPLPPVCPPPVCQPPSPPVCPPVNGSGDCKTPIDAINDNASTQKNCSVLIDVLKNDKGCGDLKITDASAENGTVEVRNGKLYYTPDNEFSGADVISYTIGDENSLTDTAHVYMTVNSNNNPSYPENKCDTVTDNSSYGSGTDISKILSMHDQEYSSAMNEAQEIFSSEMNRYTQILQDKLDYANSVTQSKSNWSASFGSDSLDASASTVHAEEPVAAC